MSRQQGLDLFHHTKQAPRPEDNRYTEKKRQTVNSLEITIPELVAQADDLILPANRLQPEVLRTYYFTAAGNQNITGFGNMWPGRKWIVVNADAVDSITLMHQNAASTAEYRIISPTGADYVLGPFESAVFTYLRGRSGAEVDRCLIVSGTGA